MKPKPSGDNMQSVLEKATKVSLAAILETCVPRRVVVTYPESCSTFGIYRLCGAGYTAPGPAPSRGGSRAWW